MYIQILITLFILFAASRSYLQFKNSKIGLGQFIFWEAIWGGVIVILFWPNLSNKVADVLGIGRGVDVFIYLSIIGLFYLVFRSYIKIEELEREITSVVRHDALRVLNDSDIKQKLPSKLDHNYKN